MCSSCDYLCVRLFVDLVCQNHIGILVANTLLSLNLLQKFKKVTAAYMHVLFFKEELWMSYKVIDLNEVTSLNPRKLKQEGKNPKQSSLIIKFTVMKV